MDTLLALRDLKTTFFTAGGAVEAIRGIDLELAPRETLALVGESGCGKSMTALSILRLVPRPGRIVGGAIHFRGQNLLELSNEEMRRVRGNQIAMIFQEPMTALNPVLRIGEQIGEALRLHKNMGRAQALEEAAALLGQVGIGDARQRLGDYPHNLSGGMRQRVMIAMALACDPALLIADEPTTALDVTIQAQIMALLARLREQRGLATLLITHDLGVVAENADRVAIMYAGLIMEMAAVAQIYATPRHPYTRGLLGCVPRLGEKRRRLSTIAGHVPRPGEALSGCPFLERCSEAFAPCEGELPSLKEVAPGHLVRCWRC